MSISINARLENADEIATVFRRLQRHYDADNINNSMLQICHDVLEPVENDIRATTPRRTGRLRKSIYREIDQAYIRQTGRLEAEAGWRFGRRLAGRYWYAAMAIEYGTRHVRARHILRNAFERNLSSMQRDFTRRFVRTFDAQIRKVAPNKLKIIRDDF